MSAASGLIEDRRSLEVALAAAEAGALAVDLRGADLRGFDLRGLRFAMVSLEGARLDGARLDGANFSQVRLTNASFRDAWLTGACFNHVSGVACNFAGSHGRDSRWERSSLQLADFNGARLQRARFVGCALEETRFASADLTLATLACSSLDRAWFAAAKLTHCETLHSTFVDAELSTARDFAYCREIVIEILGRNTEHELDMAKMIGAIARLRTICYPAWARLLMGEPRFFAEAVRVFGLYPQSGCLEAFIEPLKQQMAPEEVGGTPRVKAPVET